MRKSFPLCLLFAISVLYAGESVDHNVSFSYGFFNLTGGSIIAGNAVASSFGADDQQEDVDLLSLSSFNIAYGYELWEKLEIGGILTAEGTLTGGDILTYSYTASSFNYHSVTLMPKAKLNWINKSDFRFYSLLAIGPAFYFNSDKFETAALWQATLVGFEFGNDTSFFFELGVGQAGGFATGVKFEL